MGDAINPVLTVDKDPTAELDYGLDWSDWLGTSETITTSTWTVPTGITVSTDSNHAEDPNVPGGTDTKVWLTGGTAGTSYLVVNTIVTNQYRTDQRTICVKVRDK